MNFALIEMHEGAVPDWVLVIDNDQSREAVLSLLEARITAIMRNPHAFGGSDGINTTVTMLTVDASHQIVAHVLVGKRDGWFVNRVGGMCHKPFRVIEIREATTWPQRPGEDAEELLRTARIRPWPGGTHYCSTLRDGRVVVVGKGVSKWDTLQEAIDATRIFLGIPSPLGV